MFFCTFTHARVRTRFVMIQKKKERLCSWKWYEEHDVENIWQHTVFSRRYKEHFVLCMCSWGIMIKSMKMTRQCGTEIIDNYISTAALCVIFGLPGLHGSLSNISVPTQGNTARSTISGYGTSNFMHWHNFFSERGTQNTCVFRTCIARQNAYDYLRLLVP